MKVEIDTAAEFLCGFFKNVTDEQKDAFKAALTNKLRAKFHQHWFPERPYVGSAYRSIHSVGTKTDPILRAVAATANVPLDDVPECLTIWVDPGEVSARIGDQGSIFPLGVIVTATQTTRHTQPQRSTSLRTTAQVYQPSPLNNSCASQMSTQMYHQPTRNMMMSPNKPQAYMALPVRVA